MVRRHGSDKACSTSASVISDIRVSVIFHVFEANDFYMKFDRFRT